ncbi:hypothetical protein BaRGS_00009451 [Batillaria attramentaria]|uniref:Ribosomal protein L7Ae/L30e/S12e/Gadd45 domain-containing protein n=1 Tax=Batillaria attramentaria TaxID=370345 RepID=A0ABD0LIT9_9CAEN
MAATSVPTLSKAQIGLTLRETKKKQSSQNKSKASSHQEKRTAKKNILLSPYRATWPAVSQEIEDKVLDHLVLSQLAIGHRQVSKHLERDQLLLLLVWGGAQPSIITDSLIPLAATRSCPALCLPNLMPKLMAATGLTSLVALGFKENVAVLAKNTIEKAVRHEGSRSATIQHTTCPSREQSSGKPLNGLRTLAKTYLRAKTLSGLNDFGDFIAMAVKLAPPLRVPWATGEKRPAEEPAGGDAESDQDADVEENTEATGDQEQELSAEDETVSGTQPVIDWPVMTDTEEQQVLDKLTSLLAPYKEMFKTRRKKFQTSDWKSKRKMIRTQILTDTGTIRDAARSGKLTMLLIQRSSPPDPLASAAAISAVEHDCPVLCAARLRDNMAAVLRNPLLAAVAFRKCEAAKQVAEFSEFVTFASRFAWKDLKKLLPQKQPPPVDATTNKQDTTSPKKVAKKPPVPIYNVSHLYVYKTDTAKPSSKTTASEPTDFISLSTTPDETGARKRKVTLKEPSLSYISLSSEPDIKLLGPKVSAEGDGVKMASAFLDTKGNGQPVEKDGGDKIQTHDTDETGGRNVPFDGILGMDVADSPEVVAPFLPETTKQKRKGKASLKRKLDNSEASGEYVSFKLTPTNVQTSISNPNKAKKKTKRK